MPDPIMTLPLAAAAAIPFRVNLPLSVALVWVTNPITMIPIFYGSYKVGVWLLGIAEKPFHFEFSMEWLTTGLLNIWEPFLLGCFVLGTVSSLLGFAFVRLMWRWQIVKAHNLRKLRKPKFKGNQNL